MDTELYMVPLQHIYESRTSRKHRYKWLCMKFYPISSYPWGFNCCALQKQREDFSTSLVSLHKEGTVICMFILPEWPAKEKSMFIYFHIHLHSIHFHSYCHLLYTYFFAAACLSLTDRWRQKHCWCQERKILYVEWRVCLLFRLDRNEEFENFHSGFLEIVFSFSNFIISPLHLGSFSQQVVGFLMPGSE